MSLFFLWLNAVWTVDCSIVWQNPLLACAALHVLSRFGSIPQYFGQSPFRMTEWGWSHARKCQYYTGAFMDWSHCSQTLWKTIDYNSFTTTTPLHLFTDDYQNVKIMEAVEKGGKSCQIGSLCLACFSVCVCQLKQIMLEPRARQSVVDKHSLL